MTSGAVHVGDIVLSIVDNACVVVIFIAAVLCVHWPVCWSSSGVFYMRSVVAFLPSAAVGVAPDSMTSP